MIKDFNVYSKGLDKSLEDKMFFLDKIIPEDYDVVIDFGSGNGNLLNAISSKFSPYVDLIRIENNEAMIIAARHNTTKSNIRFQSKVNFDELSFKKVLLILSSVLHELDYKGLEDLGYYLKIATTIVVRDMQKPIKADLTLDLEHFKNKLPNYMITDYEKNHGKLNDKKNVYHMLLKYTYVENWEHEVKENYFRAKHILFVNFEIGAFFDTLYHEQFRLLHQVKAIKEKFGYELNEPTHFKMILERKKYNDKRI